MANAREIQSRMKSITDTRKITNAMYMISSTKLKKARKELEDTEPYFYTLQATIARILRHIPDMEHKYLASKRITKEEKKRGLLVITGDKGLAGAYNHNIIKQAQEWMAEGENNHLYVVGELGRQYFAGKGMEIEHHFHYTAQNPSLHRARMISEIILEAYKNEKINEVWALYTRMVNGMVTQAELVQILPLSVVKLNQIPVQVFPEEYVCMPSAEKVIDTIVPNYVMGLIYGMLVESFCSEQNARMIAMESASKSANDMLCDLSIAYNRVRQAAITQEITEIISGAKAQKQKKAKKEKSRKGRSEKRV